MEGSAPTVFGPEQELVATKPAGTVSGRQLFLLLQLKGHTIHYYLLYIYFPTDFIIRPHYAVSVH